MPNSEAVEGQPGAAKLQSPGTASTLQRTESLAARLLTSVFSSFFLITAALLCIQLLLAYRHAERRLAEDVTAMRGTFGPGIADAMWGLNDDVLAGILTGMRQLPDVIGVRVVDEQGKTVQALGTILDDAGTPRFVDAQGRWFDAASSNELFDGIISQTFGIVHIDRQGVSHLIGRWSVFSSRRIIFGEVRDQLYVVVVLAAIKTVALWIIFSMVVRRVIGRPLQQLSAHLAQLNIENLGARPFVLRDRGHHELHILADMLNAMTEKIRRSVEDNTRLVRDLHELNASLQDKVAERTRELERMATTDILTGLANRRRIDAVIAAEGQRAERFGNSLSVIIVDVDHFKSVNDNHGHQVGDLVLAKVSAILAHGVRSIDVAGRWGGEEFVVVCANTELAGALLVAERLRRSVETTEIPVVGSKTCSIGVAQLRPGESTDSMIARADAALYRAKQDGRNRVEAAM
jgi:diguanylate cyclase (GGDEF)-like protein